jgi:hypothetical protein
VECVVQGVAAMNIEEQMENAGMWHRKQGITIQGYTALFCFSAMCTTIILGLRYAYWRWRGVDDSHYTLVVKQGDV